MGSATHCERHSYCLDETWAHLYCVYVAIAAILLEVYTRCYHNYFNTGSMWEAS